MPIKDNNKDIKKENTEKSKKKSFSIPLTLIPNDDEALAKEMEDIFNEDRVTHRHGSSQPEHD